MDIHYGDTRDDLMKAFVNRLPFPFVRRVRAIIDLGGFANSRDDNGVDLAF